MGETIVYSSQHCLYPLQAEFLTRVVTVRERMQSKESGTTGKWLTEEKMKGEYAQFLGSTYVIYWLWMQTFKHTTRWKPFLLELKIPLIYRYIIYILYIYTHSMYIILYMFMHMWKIYCVLSDVIDAQAVSESHHGLLPPLPTSPCEAGGCGNV